MTGYISFRIAISPNCDGAFCLFLNTILWLGKKNNKKISRRQDLTRGVSNRFLKTTTNWEENEWGRSSQLKETSCQFVVFFIRCSFSVRHCGLPSETPCRISLHFYIPRNCPEIRRFRESSKNGVKFSDTSKNPSKQPWIRRCQEFSKKGVSDFFTKCTNFDESNFPEICSVEKNFASDIAMK